jgi:type VI protein secretion system component Hcp
MKTSVSKNVLLNDATKMLDRAYEADRSASYVGKTIVNGSSLNARMEPIKKDGTTLQYFKVTVKSAILSQQELDEIVL